MPSDTIASMFRAIGSDNFPPFSNFRLNFDTVSNKPTELAEVHLLTGVNGTGKTRILSALAALLGNPEPLQKRLSDVSEHIDFGVATGPRSDGLNVWPGHFRLRSNSGSWTRDIGELKWTRTVPAFAYSGAVYIADASVTAMAALKQEDRRANLTFVRPVAQSAAVLQGITNLKLQAAMDSLNAVATAQPSRATRLVNALEAAINEITSTSFRFQVMTYPQVALRVRWGDADLPFNLLPDGLLSIIGWLVHAVVMMDAALQGKGDPMTASSIFLLDEIENHLHPAWQRRVLPAFQRLFPKSQMIVATHSPFLIASVNYGWIHPISLQTDGSARVESQVAASKGDSYITVLEDIMGLKELYDPETEKLLTAFRAERTAAYNGDNDAASRARDLAKSIGKRSLELDYMMGRELSQMDRQLSKDAESG